MLVTQPSFTQQFDPDTTITIRDANTLAADGSGSLYAALKNGEILKFNQNLVEISNRFSPRMNAEITSLDPGNGLRILAFYESQQQFALIDRGLTQFEIILIPPQISEYAGQAALGLDQNIWITDPVEFSIKKFSPQLNQVLVNVPVETLFNDEFKNLVRIKEHESFLIIAEKNSGMHLFDNYGNYLKKLPYLSLIDFSVLDETIYVLDGSRLAVFDLFTGKESYQSLQEKNYTSIAVTEQYIFLLENEIVDVYRNVLKK